ncbi:hypothetical protein SlsnVgp103 [Spodoptera littoralis nucleopolyhedrovirus]|uniref:Pif-3 n=1 Tax=Spodoptera littoralis nuclear polyhedrosis virus TaxID=10456 RepID=M1JNZ0_NPVSL|nr:hypothetical protein SlsnVgp103 [Spodoptera littoralis nucleopolyhedrovirus]AGE89958.1 hypothetical protein SlsnVgp103 [Spodoptera littoralis nucleopolyhedrovirus]AYU75291.1 hypothetical protein [Spodoptera littoralis nucleopolyhedrovirus]
MYYDLIMIIIALLVVYGYCSYAFDKLNIERDKEIESASEPMRLVFDRPPLVNCDETRLPCVSDEQCYENCSNLNMTSMMSCNQGFCSIRPPNVAGERPDDFVCDQKLGLVRVFAASEFVVSQLCISTYRDIVDDDGNPRPYICDGGRLDIDVVNRQFTSDDCECSSGYTKYTFVQGAFARAVPVCIPNQLARIYSRVYRF